MDLSPLSHHTATTTWEDEQHFPVTPSKEKKQVKASNQCDEATTQQQAAIPGGSSSLKTLLGGTVFAQ